MYGIRQTTSKEIDDRSMMGGVTMCRINESSFALLCGPFSMAMVAQKMSSGVMSRRRL